MRLENSKGELFLDAVKKDNLYRVKIRKESASTAKARSNPMFTKSQRLHARLGHPGRNRLSDFEKMVNDIEEGSLKDRFCEHCEIGKSHRRPSKIPVRAVSALLECLHIDVYGPTEKSILGNRYMMTITDQHSKMIWVFFAKDKKGFIEMLQESTNAPIATTTRDSREYDWIEEERSGTTNSSDSVRREASTSNRQLATTLAPMGCRRSQTRLSC
jgi:hypothetical protein